MQFKEYLLQNWALILVLSAFVVSVITTVTMNKNTKRRIFVLIAAIFALSIVVFIEFHVVAGKEEYRLARTILACVRYSATPFIIAQVMFALLKRMHWLTYVPAFVLMVVNIISIFTGIVFKVDDAQELVRGPLGFSPFIIVGLYSVVLIYLLFVRSNKRLLEIIPIVFLAVALGSGLVLPFIFQEGYASIFCVTIAIALFAYHEFSTHQVMKKDSLTGLLNRHAYYAEVSNDTKNITALISIDMNGLKTINDTEGHIAGDEALVTLSMCFMKATKFRQTAYRLGGDEFVIICRKTTKEDVLKLVERIRKLVGDTKYSCSIGYSFNFEGNKPIDDLLTESDAMMYDDKEKYYRETGNDRRRVL